MGQPPCLGLRCLQSLDEILLPHQGSHDVASRGVLTRSRSSASSQQPLCRIWAVSVTTSGISQSRSQTLNPCGSCPEAPGGALQVAQYSFVFWNSTGPDRAQRRFLFPLGDLANHKCAP